MTDQTIAANFDNTVDAKDFKFTFKKDKLGNKRTPVEIKGLVPSVEGIINILQTGGKALELLQESMYDVIRAQIAADIADDEKFAQSTYDAATIQVGDATFHKYSWEGIANQPREDRRASSIPEEQWKAFGEDYLAVMPAVTAKTEEQIGNAIFVFSKKFSLVRTDKPTITMLKNQLALYAEHSKNAENFADILELLVRKADLYLGSNDIQKLVSNL